MDRKTTSIALLALLLNACALEPRMLKVERDAAQIETERQAKLAPVGLQNLRQALAAREAVTGIKAGPGDSILSVYRQVAPLFSLDGDSQTVNAAMLMGLGSLSGAFCDRLAENEAPAPANMRRAFGAVDFNASTISDSGRTQLARDLFRMALQRDPTNEESRIVAEATGRALAGGVRQAAVVACAAVLTSLNAITQ